MVASYFAIGTTLANMVNLHVYFSEAPAMQLSRRIPLLPPNKQRTDSAKARRSGFITVEGILPSVLDTERAAFIYAVFGDFVTPSAPAFVTWIDETGYYSPFSCEIDKPQEGEDYTLTPSGEFNENLRLTLANLVLQSATKTLDANVTTSERLVYVDSSGGSRTMSLPPLAGVVVDTVYSFHKSAAANSMILDPDGSETIENAATLTKTALNSRVDIVKASATNWKIVTV